MDFWSNTWEKLKKNFILWGLVGGAVLLLFSTWQNTFTPQPNPVVKQVNQDKAVNNLDLARDEEEKRLEDELVNILTQIDGVGKVSVKVNLESGKQYQYAYNENKEKNVVEEKDQQGGTRVTTAVKDGEEMVVIQDSQSGSQKPVVMKELRPAVKGVMVVAQGAEDSLVKASLLEAVQTVLEVPAYKVVVLPMKG